jgi:flavin reductase (DIM6/NTAB) family NADH-FMN oxidoreductase RutF
MRLTSDDFQAMDSRYRATLANSLSGFKPANLIGTVSTAGQPNLAIMSSVLHLGSHPPLLALVIRPDSAERHTLRNILETGCFTINHVSEPMIDAAHQTAARYPQEVSEFDATGLDALWDDNFAAPFAAQSPLRLGLELREHQHLTINDTNLVIGEIVLAVLPTEVVSVSGALDINAVGSIAISGLDTYHRGQRVKRLAYAKPDQSPQLVQD